MRAVVFVDVQNDFVKGGKLAFGFPTEDNVQKLITVAVKCRSRGDMLFATKDTHEQTVYDNYAVPANATMPKPKPISGYLTTFEGKNLPIDHCIKDTYGWNIVHGLVKGVDGNTIIPAGHIVEKTSFGSNDLRWKMKEAFDFVKEPLDEILICGYCTSICVVSNALMLRAMFQNVPIYVIEDCCGDIDEESHKAALKVMANCQIYSIFSKDV